MEIIAFDKLLLKTAFCCMAADGNIDTREIALIKSMCEKSPVFEKMNFHEEINMLVSDVNMKGKDFITNYFDLLKTSTLSEEQELALIDFAIQTIKADEAIHYSEIKFFKNIRHRLTVSDETILKLYPDIEQFLEDDIITESFLDRITKQYLESAEIPQFAFVTNETKELDSSMGNEHSN
jgi:uncharacterized tellurite resistance protein B-like protein